MIKKLRVKFVLAAMISVAIVLLLLLGTINLFGYRKVVSDADQILDVLQENGGVFPEDNNGHTWKDKYTEALSPEVPYESRYFSVTFDTGGNIDITNMGKIAAIDAETAEKYAREAAAGDKERGFIQEYRFVKYEDNGKLEIIFLDRGRMLSNFQSFLVNSIAVSGIGLLFVLIFTVIFSKKIVTPFVENYEKQKRFITDAGHEIKTPLTIIDADLTVLEMENGASEWLGDIQKQTIRLRTLTDDLIYLSKMEESIDKVEMIEFDLSDIVQDLAESFQTPAMTQGKTFECHVTPMLNFHGNIKEIQRLVSILLDNALKYSQTGGRISLTLEKKGKNITLSVFNTVEEELPANINSIFERFYRADQSRNTRTGGYGIGLSIAKAIVVLHHGRVSARTDDGKSMQIIVSFRENT